MNNNRRPLKSLGQNFLVDNNIIAKIIRNSDINPEDSVIEIGPGRGALTEHLARKAGQLVLIEYDHALAACLKERYANNRRITVVDADILSVDLANIFKDTVGWKVVANLPYNISTAVLFRLMEFKSSISRMILMLQKEVGDRLVALPGSADYGVTTVLFGVWFDIRREFVVSPDCFHPRPKVYSAVISFVPLSEPRVPMGDEAVFRRVVKSAFGMRRKTLINCMKASELTTIDNLSKVLANCRIDGKRRGETLSLDEFASLSRQLS